MTIAFIVEILLVLILFLISKNKYNHEISFLDEKKEKLKNFLPIGLKLMDLLNHKYASRYEKRLESRLSELNGGRMPHTYLKIHMAKKIALMLFALLFTTFVGTQIKVDSAYIIFGMGFLAILFYVTDKQLDDQIKERRRNIQIEFTEFLNKLILLVDAGLTVPAAIQKIIRDNKKENPLYTELGIANNEISAGKPEGQAYEDFARRCRVQDVTMFVATLLQNLRKGNDELIPILRVQANTCWENRKNIARKLGEEASTKLLLPMIIIFVAILLMMVTPAVMQISF
ncbi:MAG: type II secretion system F family protein [Clostridia bacterium]|nr:type II secretion system F family protein [Clostridia bacterium]